MGKTLKVYIHGLEKLLEAIYQIVGFQYRMVEGIVILINSTLKDNIADNSLSICKVLLEYIDLDVLNHH